MPNRLAIVAALFCCAFITLYPSSAMPCGNSMHRDMQIEASPPILSFAMDQPWGGVWYATLPTAWGPRAEKRRTTVFERSILRKLSRRNHRAALRLIQEQVPWPDAVPDVAAAEALRFNTSRWTARGSAIVLAANGAFDEHGNAVPPARRPAVMQRQIDRLERLAAHSKTRVEAKRELAFALYERPWQRSRALVLLQELHQEGHLDAHGVRRLVELRNETAEVARRLRAGETS